MFIGSRESVIAFTNYYRICVCFFNQCGFLSCFDQPDTRTMRLLGWNLSSWQCLVLSGLAFSSLGCASHLVFGSWIWEVYPFINIINAENMFYDYICLYIYMYVYIYISIYSQLLKFSLSPTSKYHVGLLQGRCIILADF